MVNASEIEKLGKKKYVYLSLSRYRIYTKIKFSSKFLIYTFLRHQVDLFLAHTINNNIRSCLFTNIDLFTSLVMSCRSHGYKQQDEKRRKEEQKEKKKKSLHGD